MQNLLWAALGVLVLNLPFGYWRYGTRKFSLPWFAAVHIPVLPVIAIRLLLGLQWFSSFWVLVLAFFSGQFLGGRVRRFMQSGA